MRRRSSVPSLLCAGAAAVALAAASGCSNTCDYGTSGSNGSNCKARPEPSAKEKAGHHAASLAPRFKEMRSAEDRADSITVNRWGEIGLELNSKWAWTSNVDGKKVKKQGSLTAQGEGSDPFDTADADPKAIDRAMSAVVERVPEAEFVAGALALRNPRVPGGADITKEVLRWTVTTKAGDEYLYYETDAKGRPQCVISSKDGTGACKGL